MIDFHFIRPVWLLLLLTLPIFIWWWKRYGQQQYIWQQWLAPHLAPLLVQNENRTPQRRYHSLLMAGVLLLSIALAGPAWERLPQPVFQLDTARVVIMDMSLSTRADDVKPDRLSQIRFKAHDLIEQQESGEAGLVAYAGDAFVIAPLTTDRNNLLNLIPALSPEIMPEQGNYPQRALQLAADMLYQAGYDRGEIIWLTDGIESRDLSELTSWFRETEHRVSILGIGSEDGAPIRRTDGSLVRDASGQVVVPRMLEGQLSDLAELGGGVYSTVTPNNNDIVQIIGQQPLSLDARDAAEEDSQSGDRWIDRGPLVALLLLPLILVYFRRGVLVSLIPATLVLGLTETPAAFAQSTAREQTQTVELPSSWWQTREQLAQQAIDNEEFELAAQLSTDSLRRGTAHYRNKNYSAALTDFAQVESPEGFYNQGNALFQMQDFASAIQAYEAALERRPNWPEAEENKALAEQQLEQQEQDQEQQGEQGEQGEQSDPESSQDESGDGESQPNEDGEATDSEDSQSPESEENQQNQTSEKPNQEDADESETEPSEQQQRESENDQPGEDDAAMAEGMEGMSDEERRQYEQMMRRLPDDPAFLLRQKMRLEHQRRQHNNPSRGVEQQW